MNRIRVALASLLLLFSWNLFTVIPVLSQESCPVLSVPKIVPGSNMFNQQQEIWLGDAEAAAVEQSTEILASPELTDYLETIVSRLAQPLPAGGLQFRVKIYEAPTGQAFSLAGGRIYVSRKLIA